MCPPPPPPPHPQIQNPYRHNQATSQLAWCQLLTKCQNCTNWWSYNCTEKIWWVQRSSMLWFKKSPPPHPPALIYVMHQVEKLVRGSRGQTDWVCQRARQRVKGAMGWGSQHGINVGGGGGGGVRWSVYHFWYVYMQCLKTHHWITWPHWAHSTSFINWRTSCSHKNDLELISPVIIIDPWPHACIFDSLIFHIFSILHWYHQNDS